MPARLLRIGWFWLLVSLITGISLYPSGMAGNDKLLHFGAYLVLFISLDLAYRAGRGLLGKLLLLFACSLLIEVMQSFIPHRQFSLGDLVANLAGLLLGLAVAVSVGRFLQARDRLS